MSVYVVTGGGGFIGSHIVEELLRRNETVRVIDNFSTGKRENVAPFANRAEVIEQLSRHGVHPTASTDPQFVRNYVRDLYKYEIRQLRARYLQRQFPKAEYWIRVDALRRQYPVLALRAEDWLDS